MTTQHTPSNPRQCEHSMVTDICGLCIRDRTISQLAALNSELEANLAHADDAYTHYKELNAELVAALKPLTYKFISGNSVTVDRATITAEEWRPVFEALAKESQI